MRPHDITLHNHDVTEHSGHLLSSLDTSYAAIYSYINSSTCTSGSLYNARVYGLQQCYPSTNSYDGMYYPYVRNTIVHYQGYSALRTAFYNDSICNTTSMASYIHYGNGPLGSCSYSDFYQGAVTYTKLVILSSLSQLQSDLYSTYL